jgi:Tir chaperone protein (CesT) family
MLELVRALFAELAAVLGIGELPVDNNGAARLTVGEDTTVALFAQLDRTLLIVLPLGPLPPQTSYTLAFWLLRRNLYASDLAPFTLACDEAGTLVLWGRVPLSDLTGESLAHLVDALAAEARRIQDDIASV